MRFTLSNQGGYQKSEVNVLSLKKTSQHERMAQAVERSLRKVCRDTLQGAALDGCLALWREFAAQIDLGRTRKPQAWAAALIYTYERMRLGGYSQGDVAHTFGVSSITVSQKYRQMTTALNLVLLDARYVPEAMRAAVQREEGPLPEALPLQEAPTGWARWSLPLESAGAVKTWLEQRERDPLRRAQGLVYDGWEALEDPEEAERCFNEALRLDPTLADAHNGLANVAEAAEDLALAQAHYRKAYELARDTLGTEAPRAFVWWGELETRPYMRAREGLGWVNWQRGRYRAAIVEYEALLNLNPDDNQGVRYILAPLYQLGGDLKGALRAYAQYEQAYPDDMGDPHYTFCWGLALYEAGHAREAVFKWRQALFENVYTAPLLLGQRPPGEEFWTFSNMAWPDYAEEYVETYGRLWKTSAKALGSLRRLWRDEELQTDLQRWLLLGQRLQTLSNVPRDRRSGVDPHWKELLDERRAVEQRVPSQALLQRVVVD